MHNRSEIYQFFEQNIAGKIFEKSQFRLHCMRSGPYRKFRFFRTVVHSIKTLFSTMISFSLFDFEVLIKLKVKVKDFDE